MLQKAARRDEARRLWRIGTPFDETAREAIEVKMAVGNVGFPPFTGRRSRTEWTEGSLVEAIGIAVAGALREAGEIPKKAAPRTGDRGEGWVRSLLQAGDDDEAGEVFAEAMQQGDGDQQGDGQGNRAGRQQSGGNQTDPLGRPLHGREFGDDYTVKIPGEIDVQRVRRILEELRRRLADPSRPQIELDYIERLLKDY